MELEEGMVQKIAVATGAVIGFLAIILLIGITMNGGDGLNGTGGLALIASIVLFVLVMAGVGFYLDE